MLDKLNVFAAFWFMLHAQVIVAECADNSRDPGYWGTARLVLEAGLCLALDSGACTVSLAYA
jgi:hypothetical protein